MIVDLVSNWGRCFRGCPGEAYWRACFEFLLGLSPEILDGRHAISGDDVYGLVSSYQTRPVDAARFEAHRNYVDVQMVLSGAERLGWAPLQGLEVAQPYDPAKDVEFHAFPDSAASFINAVPGLFVAFFPWDAHMPQVSAGLWPVPVRKVVVKVRMGAVGL